MVRILALIAENAR